MPDAAELLAAYDAQLRGRVPEPLPAGLTAERDGPLVRLTGWQSGGFVGYRDLDRLDGPDLDALIARQVRFFAERGDAFEWKLDSHDLPSDLPERLTAAGFVPDEAETVVIAPVDALDAAPQPPEGITLRETRERADLDRIDELKRVIWQDDSPLADDLEVELAADPDGLTIVLAEAADVLVCAGWVRFEHGTEFATLWGGGTLPAWRGRGVYRSIVAYRARLAAARGFRFLQVDASDDSRPILERLGFVAVTTTTPYHWSPDA